MARIPTVKVVNPNEPGGYMIINACDMTPDHRVWRAPLETNGNGNRADLLAPLAPPETETMPPPQNGMKHHDDAALNDDAPVSAAPPSVETSDGAEDKPAHVGRGPRGKWYIKRARKIIAGPFETEAAAQAEMMES